MTIGRGLRHVPDYLKPLAIGEFPQLHLDACLFNHPSRRASRNWAEEERKASGRDFGSTAAAADPESSEGDGKESVPRQRSSPPSTSHAQDGEGKDSEGEAKAQQHSSRKEQNVGQPRPQLWAEAQPTMALQPGQEEGTPQNGEQPPRRWGSHVGYQDWAEPHLRRSYQDLAEGEHEGGVALGSEVQLSFLSKRQPPSRDSSGQQHQHLQRGSSRRSQPNGLADGHQRPSAAFLVGNDARQSSTSTLDPALAGQRRPSASTLGATAEVPGRRPSASRTGSARSSSASSRSAAQPSDIGSGGACGGGVSGGDGGLQRRGSREASSGSNPAARQGRATNLDTYVSAFARSGSETLEDLHRRHWHKERDRGCQIS